MANKNEPKESSKNKKLSDERRQRHGSRFIITCDLRPTNDTVELPLVFPLDPFWTAFFSLSPPLCFSVSLSVSFPLLHFICIFTSLSSFIAAKQHEACFSDTISEAVLKAALLQLMSKLVRSGFLCLLALGLFCCPATMFLLVTRKSRSTSSRRHLTHTILFGRCREPCLFSLKSHSLQTWPLFSYLDADEHPLPRCLDLLRSTSIFRYRVSTVGVRESKNEHVTRLKVKQNESTQTKRHFALI